MDECITIDAKWNNIEFKVNLTLHHTVRDLKEEIFKEVKIKPERQKLINLKFKEKGKILDETVLSDIKFSKGFKLMIIGSKEEDIEELQAGAICENEVVNDFEVNMEEVEFESKSIYLEKIERRIKQYKIKYLGTPRIGKKLLVLDIDYTLFDHCSVAEKGIELMRPYLHDFLTIAYEDYDIIIWSATGMKWIDEKLKVLGITGNSQFTLLGCMDSQAMISVETSKGLINVKPLALIWGLLPMYGAHNTIMFDDVRHNFLMNPQNGLKIKAFRKAHFTRYTDDELLHLSHYLKAISTCENFLHLNHDNWKHFIRHKK